MAREIREEDSIDKGGNSWLRFRGRGEIPGIESNSNSNNDVPRVVWANDKGTSLDLGKDIDSVKLSGKDVILPVCGVDLMGNVGLEAKDKPELDGGHSKFVGSLRQLNLGLPIGLDVVENLEKTHQNLGVSRVGSKGADILLSDEGIRPSSGGAVNKAQKKYAGLGKGKWKKAARQGPLIGSGSVTGRTEFKRKEGFTDDVFCPDSKRLKADVSEVCYDEFVSVDRLSPTHREP
ncbi:hypothetical protein LWI29_008637 [Acer saccharum]|uniref:Uncharacterized protein n=1 Tax=Acer saccharum TaxID=4024 RepID=A0AA39S4P7_ACESA|nr:hypothetical protein LWI29_008637 [Acer saccharum]